MKIPPSLVHVMKNEPSGTVAGQTILVCFFKSQKGSFLFFLQMKILKIADFNASRKCFRVMQYE